MFTSSLEQTRTASIVVLFTCLLSLDWIARIGLSGVVEDKYSCPHGWTRYGNKKCLKYVSELQDYERAQATCRSKNQGTLVTVHSHEEQNFVYSYIHSIAASSTPIWLGAKQIDFESILWLDKTENSYTNWAPSEPSHPDEICIAINPRNGLWHDVMCTEANVPACERAPTTQWPFFVAFCSEGWFQFNDEKCVRIISSQALNFYESQELCRSKYNSKLLSIKTDKESEFVHNLIKFRDVKLPVWLGAVQNDFSSFNWIDKSDVTFTNWAEGEPNDPDHACISMVASGGKWSDNDCKEQKLILCQKVVTEEGGACETGWLQFRQDKCYRFVHIRLAFDDAETLCNNLYGGHLPSIHSQEEQFMIAQFLASVNVKNGSEIWLGGRQMDFHNFNWGDGSPFNYSYWEQGEPSFPAEKCIEMSWRNGRWNDINCRLKRAVLCERQVSSRHHLKPNLYQPATLPCLEPAGNCTGGAQATGVGLAPTGGGSGSSTALASPAGLELAPSGNGGGDQLLTVNGTSGSNSTALGGATSAEPTLPPDDKPIKVISSIMNRDQQAAGSLQPGNRSQSLGGLTSKSASGGGASDFGAPLELAPPVASNASSTVAFIHYNLPPPERMFDTSQYPPLIKLEEQQQKTATVAQAPQEQPPAPVSSQPLLQQQQQEQPPVPASPPIESTVSLLDKLKQATSTTTTVSSVTASPANTTSLPESTKASDSNTTALNAPTENVVADQQQQQSVSPVEQVRPAQVAAGPVQHQAALTTQEFAQVTQSVAATTGSNYPREKINHASEGGELENASAALAQAKGVN